MKKVMLDAGHGGHDSGATGYGYKESNLALGITLLIGKYLQKSNVKVFYTRTTDRFIELKNRSKEANDKKVDAFISLHLNAANPKAKGLEVYRHPRGNSKLAEEIYKSLIEDKLFTLKRGVREANFLVLRKTRMASALVELVFITNKEDLDLLLNNKENFANAIARGICKYFNIPYKDQIKNLNNNKPIKEEKREVKDININVIGKEKTISAINEKGQNYVSLRELSELLGFEVSYDNKTKKIGINFKETPVRLDGKDIVLPTNKVNGDTNQVGLRVLAEQLGAKVDWDEENKKIIIKTK